LFSLEERELGDDWREEGLSQIQPLYSFIGRSIMKAYRVELTVPESGALTLEGLPFQAGAAVEIIVLERSEPSQSAQLGQNLPLAEKVLHYEDPFGPATDLEAWDVLQ
jgi:hypothetical protein